LQSPLSFAFGLAFFGLKMIEKYIKAPEVLLPKLAVLLQPGVELLQRGGRGA
jgi:hypothetical protein